MSKTFALETDLTFKTTHFVGSAFISFKYQHFREYILELYEQDYTEFQMKGKYLKISKAPGPTDVIW